LHCVINDLTCSDMKDLATRIKEAKEEAMDILRGLMAEGEDVEDYLHIANDNTWDAEMSVCVSDGRSVGIGSYECKVYGYITRLTVYESVDDDTVAYEEEDVFEDTMTLDYQDDLEVYGRCG